jgi:hypothetical protein
MSYSETIAALKDFTAAQHRLDAAAKKWDDVRFNLFPQYEEGVFRYCFLVKPEYIGDAAQEFLSAHNAYERLGSAEVDPFEGGICELGR